MVLVALGLVLAIDRGRALASIYLNGFDFNETFYTSARNGAKTMINGWLAIIYGVPHMHMRHHNH